MPTKQRKVVIYVRVSTSGQEDGTSLETQEAEGVNFADSLGHDGNGVGGAGGRYRGERGPA